MLLKDQIISKLQRYVLYISMVFFTLSLTHLVYAYLYSGSKNIPIKWGSISEAIIWDFPHLNPLIPSSDYNKYITSILYRSLLKYSVSEGKFVSDIASCDIKNLLVIECFLQNDIKWSDGSDITTDDIIATFTTLKTTDVNPIIASLLSNTKIEERERSIVFTNQTWDINFLNVFLQPIVPTKILNTLSTEEFSWKFSIEWKLYSGPYKLESIWQDESLWIKRLTLEKNEFFSHTDVFIDKIVFKIFDDTNHFLKHKDSVNLYNDKSNIIADSIPRLEAHEYILPQYVGIYINTEKIPEVALRAFILNQINRDDIVKWLSDNNFKPVYNPFITEDKIDKDISQTNVEQIINTRGYSKKSQLLKSTVTPQKTISWEAVVTEKKTLEIEKSRLITSPQVDNINFLSADDVLLKGKVEDTWVTAIYINEYQLKWYAPGNSEFYYRLKEASYETIKEGKNVYKIYFEKSGVKELKEELTFYYYKDENTLAQEKQKVLADLVRDVTSTPIQPVTEVVQTPSSPQEIEKMKKIEALEDTFFYDVWLNKFTLKLYYLDTEKSIFDTATFIKGNMAQYGIEVELVWLSLMDLNELLKKWSKEYDMILAGVNVWYFDYNLFPYLHSSQIKNGYNFAQFKKLSLDILLEEAKSNSLHEEKIQEIETKILSILKEEQFMKTLYTPVLRNLVDKNIKNYSMKEYLYDDVLRFQGLDSAYIEEKKIIDFWGKWFFGFFGFLKNTLFW